MDAISSRIAAGLAAQKNSASAIAGMLNREDPSPVGDAAATENPAVIKTISSEDGGAIAPSGTNCSKNVAMDTLPTCLARSEVSASRPISTI
jgi:hypothetical protein